jgi:diguanylate cyclase (GGDEF)-like protein
MNKARRNRRILFFLLLVFLVGIIYLALTLPSEDYGLVKRNLIDLNEGWRVEYEDTTLQEVSFPRELHLKENTRYTAARTLPTLPSDSAMLRVRSSMQDIIVYVDGVEIFRDLKGNSGWLTAPDASLWHFLSLPEGSSGKEITLEMVSPTRAFSGTLNEVYVGEGIDLLAQVIRANAMKIILSILFLILGIFMLILSSFVKNLEDNRLIYLGGFAVLFSVWLFGESKVLQLFTGNRFIIGGISYMVIPLIAISYVLFLKESVLQKFKSVMVALAILFFVNLVGNVLLQVFGILNFISSMALTVVLVSLMIVSSMVLMAIEWKMDGNLQARTMILSSFIPAVFLLAEVSTFLLGRYEMTGSLTGIGILLFFLQISYFTFRSVDKAIQSERESEFLKKMAYVDILTGMGNRAAFEKYVDGLRKKHSGKQFRLAMMDINNLKYINDHFGHKEGDAAIRKCAKAMKKYLLPYGDCFRLGGDEFAAILYDLDEETYAHLIRCMREEIHGVENNHPYRVDIVVGSNVYQEDRFTDFGTFIHETDLRMYENKRKVKENQLEVMG